MKFDEDSDNMKLFSRYAEMAALIEMYPEVIPDLEKTVGTADIIRLIGNTDSNNRELAVYEVYDIANAREMDYDLVVEVADVTKTLLDLTYELVEDTKRLERSMDELLEFLQSSVEGKIFNLSLIDTVNAGEWTAAHSESLMKVADAQVQCEVKGMDSKSTYPFAVMNKLNMPVLRKLNILFELYQGNLTVRGLQRFVADESLHDMPEGWWIPMVRSDEKIVTFADLVTSTNTNNGEIR